MTVRRYSHFLVVVWLSVVGIAVEAADLAVLRVDGRSVRGTLENFSLDHGVTVRVDGGEVTIDLDEVLQIDCAKTDTSIESAPASMVFHLKGGGRLFGRIVASADEGVRVKTTSLGEATLAFKHLRAIRSQMKNQAKAVEMFERSLAAPDVGKDVVVLVRDGKVRSFKGIVETLSTDGGQFRYRDRALPLNREFLFGIVFAKGSSSGSKPPLTVELLSGESFGGRLHAGDSAGLGIKTTFAAEVTIPWSRMKRLIFRNDNVVFLSDLEPVSYRFRPFFNIDWPYRMDRAVSGTPLRLNGQSYAKGVGVHSSATLSFRVPPGFRKLVGVLGIDDAVRPRGNVEFRVTTEGRELFKRSPVRGTDPPKPFQINLEHVSIVDLVVDFGEQLDIADHADWANVRFVK